MLGPLLVTADADRPVTPVRRKQRELLGLLLVRAGTVVGTAEIVDTLWGARPPASARANVHSYVWGLRGVLATTDSTVRPVRMPHGYLLDLGADECDAAVFDATTAAGQQALAAGRPAQAADHLARALALWRGPVLDGIERADWLAPTAARLEEARLAAIEDHIQARLQLGRLGGLAVELTDATTRYPLRERLWGHLMVALDRTGRRAEALDAYVRLYDVLERELGTQPGPAIRRLHRRIRADA